MVKHSLVWPAVHIHAVEGGKGLRVAGEVAQQTGGSSLCVTFVLAICLGIVGLLIVFHDSTDPVTHFEHSRFE